MRLRLPPTPDFVHNGVPFGGYVADPTSRFYEQIDYIDEDDCIYNEDDLNEITDNKLYKVVIKYLEKHVASSNRYDIGELPNIEFSLQFKKDCGPPDGGIVYPLPKQQYEYLKIEIEKLLKAGLIEPSDSPHAAPTFLVVKPDGSWRIVHDFKKLNAVTETYANTLPNSKEAVQQAAGYKYYATLDIRSGFNHISIAEWCKRYVSFTTPFGTFQWKRLPFGLKNAPAYFQQALYNIFKDLDGIQIFVDDIIICSNSIEEHISKVEEVLARLLKYDLKLRLDKCHFLETHIKYLGYIISENGIEPDEKYNYYITFMFIQWFFYRK